MIGKMHFCFCQLNNIDQKIYAKINCDGDESMKKKTALFYRWTDRPVK